MEASENFLLLGALENVLGKGYRRARGNFAFHCPFCNHLKPKLEVSLIPNSKGEHPWECWVCKTRGRTIQSLVKHLGLSREESSNVLQYVQKVREEEHVELRKPVRLPDEFVPLELAPATSVYAKRVKNYLYSRGLTDVDFIRYGLGYCMRGKYADRVIIPSYDSSNCLNFFTGRSILPGAYMRYLNPDCSKDIIFFENLINWNEPLLLCEGPFDAMALRRNAVPLQGKSISKALMTKILENPVPEIYIILDRDAKQHALEFCEEFLRLGKRVYFVYLDGKDPSQMGFEEVTRILHSAEELTLRSLLEYKIAL